MSENPYQAPANTDPPRAVAAAAPSRSGWWSFVVHVVMAVLMVAVPALPWTIDRQTASGSVTMRYDPATSWLELAAWIGGMIVYLLFEWRAYRRPSRALDWILGIANVGLAIYFCLVSAFIFRGLVLVTQWDVPATVVAWILGLAVPAGWMTIAAWRRLRPRKTPAVVGEFTES